MCLPSCSRDGGRCSRPFAASASDFPGLLTLVFLLSRMQVVAVAVAVVAGLVVEMVGVVGVVGSAGAVVGVAVGVVGSAGVVVEAVVEVVVGLVGAAVWPSAGV